MIQNDFRTVLLNSIPLDNNPAVLLSGGTDSSTVLAAFLSRGIKPTCYTFQLGNIKSTDMKVAESMAKTHKFELKKVIIPQNEETLIKDIKSILTNFPPKKTIIQCCHPFLYIYPLIKNDGFGTVYSGLWGDDILGTSRKGNVIYHQQGEEAFRKFRQGEVNKPNTACEAITKMAGYYNLKFFTPFNTEPVIDFLLSKKYNELHKPIQKGISIYAFPEFWNKGQWYRKNSSLHVNSGIREFHDTLLNSRVNTCNAKHIIKLYNLMALGAA